MRGHLIGFDELYRASHHTGPFAQNLHVTEHDKTRGYWMIGQRNTQVRTDARWLTCGDRQQW